MKKVFIVLLVSVGFISCKKGFLDINSTPNNPVTVTPAAIFPNTTIAIAFATGNELNRATGALVQHMAGTANQVAQYDVFLLDQFSNSWSFEIYNGAINNLQRLIDLDSAQNPAYSGVAKIEMAYAFSLATDLWGDVPYSQAGQGLLYETPRFDKQEDIYQGNPTLGIRSLFDLVKSGIADLDKPTNILKPSGLDDLVYAGDLTKWKRFANSLLLKFAIQISNRNPVLAKSTIESVLTGNLYINQTSLDFEVPFGVAVGNRNPIFDFNNNLRTGDQMLSSRLLTLSRSLNDTIRLAKFFTKPTGTFVAFNNGSTAAAPALATRSRYNTYLTGDPDPLAVNTFKTGGAAPIRIMTWYQVNFYLAEAALILGTPGDPNTYYQTGIRTNMLKIGMTQAEIDTFFVRNPTVVTLAGTTEDKRKQIITQKYLASIGYPIEVYNDYRRTGYPVLTLPLNAQGDNPNVIPTRLVYPSSELARNPNAPSPRPKTDVKLWWAL